MLLVTAVVTLLADQASKAAVRSWVPPQGSIPLVPGVLWLTRITNTGAAFGLMSGQQLLFIVTTIAVLAGIAFVWFRYRPRGRLVVLALGLVTGGALGNLVDRLTVGRVTDFLDVHFWPVFNIADSAVVVGVAILVVWLLFLDDEEEQEDAGHAGHPGEA